MTRVLVLNGPNLNRLGTREPDIYGTATLDDLRASLAATSADAGSDADPHLDIDLRQTNDEAELIGWLHEAADTGDPVILNAAAFTHYSYALADAAALVTTGGGLLVEVHLSNPSAREEFRRTSVITPVATGVIAGFGFDSYLLALDLVRRRVG